MDWNWYAERGMRSGFKPPLFNTEIKKLLLYSKKLISIFS